MSVRALAGRAMRAVRLRVQYITIRVGCMCAPIVGREWRVVSAIGPAHAGAVPA